MHTQKLTKIVATVGPASETEDKIEQLIKAGVNVFRFNTKHSTPDWHASKIRLVQKVADRLGVTIGILLDLQGPEIRLETRDQQEVKVGPGELLKIGVSFRDGIDIIIPHAAIFGMLAPGDELLVDDGFIEAEVVKCSTGEIIVEVKHDSVIKNRKGVNLPGKDIDFPGLIDRDLEQLDINAQNKVDFVGLSFVRSAHDIAILRAEMLKREMKALIVAKIENQPALDRLDEIIQDADAIMIARGDLGVEVPYEQLAYWQRDIIDRCRLAHKPVITATQMLESMIVNPRPTRAEVTDVAHAIFEGTDAIMLSGESAGGKYPVRAVETMDRIARWNEKKRIVHEIGFDETDPTNTIANAVASIVRSKISPHIDSVLVFTETGYTARAIAKHRLSLPVIAVSANRRVAESITLSFGIFPVVADLPTGKFSSVSTLIDDLLKRDILHHGQTVVIVHGHHWQKAGNTNSLTIQTI